MGGPLHNCSWPRCTSRRKRCWIGDWVRYGWPRPRKQQARYLSCTFGGLFCCPFPALMISPLGCRIMSRLSFDHTQPHCACGHVRLGVSEELLQLQLRREYFQYGRLFAHSSFPCLHPRKVPRDVLLFGCYLIHSVQHHRRSARIYIA
jgi:hypothetical protein